jgi:hypothetical protein
LDVHLATHRKSKYRKNQALVCTSITRGANKAKP